MSTPPAITVKEDFSDWLNPMLVKELRQGLKTKAFVIVFVLVQVALVILMGFRLLAQNDPFGYTAGMLDGLLWTAIGGALLVLMPLRALTAISEEEKANTLHLVQLTRLSSTRIVWGKWIALVSQTLLLSVAILPYAVLRYFFGGIDIVENLLLLVWMMVGSMALTAACLVLSTHAMPTRIVLLVGALPAISIFSSAMVMVASLGGSSSGPPVLSMIHAVVMTTLFLLALAASRIAPAAENHALIMRVIALVAALIATVATMISDSPDDSAWIGLLLPMLFIAVLQALVERTSEVPSVYAALAKRGGLSKLTGCVFYPGWATGMVFTAVLVGLLAVCMGFMEGMSTLSPLENAALAGLLFVALISPVVLLRSLSKMRGWTYVFLQVAALLLLAMGEMLDGISSISDETIAAVMGVLPTSAYLWCLGNQGESGDFWSAAIVGGAIGAAILVVILLRALREFRLIRTMEAQATAPNDKA